MSLIKNKVTLEAIYLALDKMESALGKPSQIGNMHLRDVFQLDTYRYVLYLSASDGRLSSSERDYMNSLFGTNYSIDSLVSYINEKNIYSRDFESTPPLSFVIALAQDVLMTAVSSDWNPLYGILGNFYKDLGLDIIQCDGNVSESEKEDLLTYLKTLHKLIESSDPEEEYGKIGGKK